MIRQEQETIIRRCGDEDSWDVYSSIPSDMRKFRELAELYERDTDFCDEVSIRVELPLRAIVYKRPPSEAARQRGRNLAQRMNGSDVPRIFEENANAE